MIVKPILLLTIIAIVSLTNVSAQIPTQTEASPDSEIQSFIQYQPLSPLKIEKAQVFIDDGQSHLFYVVRNVSKKPVRGYTIARWYSDNTGSVTSGAMPGSRGSLMPGQQVIFGEAPSHGGSRSTARKIDVLALFMIVEVTFVDGTSYSDGERMAALEDHLRLFEPSYNKKNKENFVEPLRKP